MKQLSNTISRLKTDPLNAVTVTDKDTLAKVVTDATGSVLEERYGSVEGFFEWMHGQGINRLLIKDRRKNGSGFKAIGEYHADLMQKNGSEPAPPAKETAYQPQNRAPMPVQDLFSGGFGMNGLGGLSMPDVFFKTQDHGRLVSENAQLKAKVEALEEANKKLEKENFKNEIVGTNTVEKANANNELIKTLQPILTAMAGKFLGPADAGAAAGGLAGSQNLSPIRQSFHSLADNADEALLQDLLIVLQGLQIAEFDTELTELMKKHKLIIE